MKAAVAGTKKWEESDTAFCSESDPSPDELAWIPDGEMDTVH